MSSHHGTETRRRCFKAAAVSNYGEGLIQPCRERDGHLSGEERRGADGRPDEESGHEVARWNLRKCSAAALDVLSTVFEEDLLPIVSPVVEQRLQARGAPPPHRLPGLKCMQRGEV